MGKCHWPDIKIEDQCGINFGEKMGFLLPTTKNHRDGSDCIGLEHKPCKLAFFYESQQTDLFGCSKKC